MQQIHLEELDPNINLRNILDSATDAGQVDVYGLTSFINRIVQEERKRISQDLHDEASQTLSIAMLILEKIYESSDAKIRPQLEQVHELLHTTSCEIKDVSIRLTSYLLDEMGFPAAMEMLETKFSRNLDLEMNISLESNESKQIRHITVPAYWVIHEALSNVIRHANAKDVFVKAFINNGFLILEVKDSGSGFKLENISPCSRGLRNIKQRVLQEGGKLEICSAPGYGTRITAEFPILDNALGSVEPATSFSMQNQLRLF